MFGSESKPGFEGTPANPAGTPPQSTPRPAPALHIDADWKAQAQAEKARLAEKEAQREASREHSRGPAERARGAASGAGADLAGGVGAEDLPPADFRTLVGVLASQALMGLGGYGDPKSGRVVVDLQGAKLSIDLLAVLEEKTRNNLTADEAQEIREVLAELRSRFVHFADLVARQQAASAAAALADPNASAIAAAAKLRGT
ncbi:MAG: DUF1844 domain-containing protein [Phycisphaerales bacterium]|jgi:hypothetical protein